MSVSKPYSQMSVRQAPLPWLVVAFLTAILSYQFSSSMLSPALTTMRQELQATSGQIALTQTVFFASSAVFSIFLPRLGDLIGRRKTTLAMLAIATIGSAVSALASDIILLIVGRLLQGVTGPIISLCLLMLRARVNDNKQYATLLAVVTCTNGGLAGLDALAGGWLVQEVGFRGIFWTMSAFGVLGFALVAVFAQESRSQDSTQSRMDWAGTGCLMAMVASAITAFSVSEFVPATHATFITFTLIAISFASLLLFFRTESRVVQPLAPVPYLRRASTWGFLATVFISLVGVFGLMNGIIPALAQSLSYGAGMGVVESTFVTLVPYSLVGMIIAPFTGIIAGRVGYVRVLRIGLLVAIAGGLTGVYAASNPSPGMLIVCSVLLGAGYVGIVNIMINGLAVALSPVESPGCLPGLNAGIFNLGAGLSYTLLFGISNSSGSFGGFSGALSVGSGLLLLALVFSFVIQTSGHSRNS